MIEVRNFITKYFKTSQIKTISKFILETQTLELFLQNALIRTIGDLLKRPVPEKGDGDWIYILPIITKHYNNQLHTSTKLTPIQASLKKMKDSCTIIY